MKLTTIALLFTLSTVSVTSISAQAKGSAQHSGQASKHSVLAVGHGALSTAKVASAVVAIPVVVAGSVALTAGAAAASIVDASSQHHRHDHGPLLITETTITADPAPNKVIITQKKQIITHSH